jgi:uncharacterized Zn finger protein
MSRSRDQRFETRQPQLVVVITCPDCQSNEVELIEDGPYAPLYQCKACARMWIEPELKSGH